MLVCVFWNRPILLKSASSRKRRLSYAISSKEIILNTIDGRRTKGFSTLRWVVTSTILDNVVLNFVAKSARYILLIIIPPAIYTDILHIIGGTPLYLKFSGNITYILYRNGRVRPPAFTRTSEHIYRSTPLNGKSAAIGSAWVERHGSTSSTVLAPELIVVASGTTHLLRFTIRTGISLPPSSRCPDCHARKRCGKNLFDAHTSPPDTCRRDHRGPKTVMESVEPTPIFSLPLATKVVTPMSVWILECQRSRTPQCDPAHSTTTWWSRAI